MPTAQELKRIYFCRSLTDEMLEQIAPLVQQATFEKDAVIFEQGDRADFLYMLVKGKVLLNMEASATVCVTVMSSEPAECFGWSSILGGSYYSASAVSTEEVTVWIISARDLMVLLYHDHSMGFKVMDFAAREMNRRLTKRTNQLFKTLLEHIDMVCNLNESKR